MLSTATRKGSALGDILQLEGFERLAGELQPWRKSDDLKIMEQAKGSALVLPFVKGFASPPASFTYCAHTCRVQVWKWTGATC